MKIPFTLVQKLGKVGVHEFGKDTDEESGINLIYLCATANVSFDGMKKKSKNMTPSALLEDRQHLTNHSTIVSPHLCNVTLHGYPASGCAMAPPCSVG